MKSESIVLGFQVLITAMTLASGVSVTLNTPTNRYLRDEVIPVSIIVSNGTAASFFVEKATPFSESAQLYWCVSPQEQMDALTRFRHLPLPRNAWRYVTQQQITNRPLMPGESIVWNDMGVSGWIPSKIFDCFTNVNLYAQVLVGSNVWACSNTNLVKSTTVMIENGTLLLESTFESPQRPAYPFNVRIYEHTIDGERFLFYSALGQRICAVPENATPNFAINTNAAMLTVTFSGTNAPPVSYNLNAD